MSYTLYEDTKNSQIKSRKQLQSVTESLEFLSTKFDTLEKECDKQNEKTRKLEENIEKLEERNKLLVESVHDLEQYSRRNCLRLLGVKETKNGNTDEVTIKTLREEM